MTKRCFKAIVSFKKVDKQLLDEEIWEFLVQLGLATEIKDKDESLYIPSLLASGNENFMNDQLDNFKASEDSLGFHYSFHKSEKVSQLFTSLLPKLASNEQFFYKMRDPGIYFERSYSAKIENRSLGLVAGLRGSLKWTDTLSSTKQKVDFLLLEYDIKNSDFNFAIKKVVFWFIRSYDSFDPSSGN